MNEPQVNSLENVKRIATAVDKVIEPPCELSPIAMGYWEAGLKRRARIDWDEHDLGILAQLAGLLELLQLEREALAHEGTLIVNQKGAESVSPRVHTVGKLVTAIGALNRAIGLQHAQRPGNPGPKQRKDEISRKIEEGLEERKLSLIKRD